MKNKVCYLMLTLFLMGPFLRKAESAQEQLICPQEASISVRPTDRRINTFSHRGIFDKRAKIISSNYNTSRKIEYRQGETTIECKYSKFILESKIFRFCQRVGNRNARKWDCETI